jgi:hypothetical protein
MTERSFQAPGTASCGEDAPSEFPAFRRKCRYAVGIGNAPSKLPMLRRRSRCAVTNQRCPAGAPDVPSTFPARRRRSRHSVRVHNAPSRFPTRRRRSRQTTGNRECPVGAPDAPSKLRMRRRELRRDVPFSVCRVADDVAASKQTLPSPEPGEGSRRGKVRTYSAAATAAGVAGRPSFSRIFSSISSARSGLSRRNCLEFSRPWPRRRSP